MSLRSSSASAAISARVRMRRSASRSSRSPGLCRAPYLWSVALRPGTEQESPWTARLLLGIRGGCCAPSHWCKTCIHVLGVMEELTAHAANRHVQSAS